jgi:EAL domain-containing protein (putative c-di-GMP-specific phosphodiesterase class I)
MDQAVHPHKELVDRLVSALRQDEFVLYGQQILPLAPKGDERPFREILIRFQEEEEKLLPPGTFFPVLEECGLMPYVDRWVVGRVAKWIRAALAVKPDWPVPHSGINLSADTLSDPKFADYARKHIQAAGLPEGALSFEVTCDSAVERFGPLLGLMAPLRQAGCRFILARFDGSKGAFELLRRVAPEFVKLSPSLVRSLNQGAAGMEQVAAVNRLCHALRIKTIAEHVESDETIEQLRALEVDFAQGFGIQTPQPLV